MCARRQFARAGIAAIAVARRLPSVLLVASLWLCAAFFEAPRSQAQMPSSAVGSIEGKDISVESTMAIGGTVGQSSSGDLVSNGSIVTVHSGHARLSLFAGGHVEICGPAKFTMLQTNGAITLALNFGRVRVELPLNSSLRVFTPTIIATPLDISGGARDVAVGLNLDDSLCVRATSGAIQLEHQFSGEKLIVPQEGEFFLNAGQLLPVAGTPGSCECEDASDSSPIVVPDTPQRHQYAIAITRPSRPGESAPTSLPPPELAAAPPASAATLAPIPPAEIPKPEPDFDLQLLAEASEAHPVAPPKDSVSPQPTPEPVPASSTTVAAPLVYMAPTVQPPLDPGPDVILLIREAQVTPDWEFSGHVNAPDFALAVQQALGQRAASPAAPQQESNPGHNEKKKGGFWASLKRMFGGGSGPQVE